MNIHRDFNKWNAQKIDWATVKFDYNTGRKYQHKQDLEALFWNSYIYYEHKFKTYYSKFNCLPDDYIKDLIFEFRQHFPKDSSRIAGINYFDDLIELLLEKYNYHSNKNSTITGFETKLSETQITNLYNASKEYIETDLQNLNNLLTGKKCNPVIWKYYRGVKPNKRALRAFIIAIFQDPKNPKTIGKLYFTDMKGNTIEISKRVDDPNYQGYIEGFEVMIKKE